MQSVRQRLLVSREQERVHARYWGIAQTGELTYAALGDSAGVGVGVDDLATSYVSRVAAALQDRSGKSVAIANLSVSGARAADVLEHQVPQLSDLSKPDHVTCVVGGNDVAWARRFDAKAFGQTISEIAAQLPRRSVLGLVPSFWHWPYDARAKRANAAIESAAQNHGHFVANIYAKTKALGFRRYLGTLSKDFFHPNEHGYKLWAEAIIETLNPTCG